MTIVIAWKTTLRHDGAVCVSIEHVWMSCSTTSAIRYSTIAGCSDENTTLTPCVRPMRSGARMSAAPVAEQRASVRTADTPFSGAIQHASTDTTATDTTANTVWIPATYKPALEKSMTASSASTLPTSAIAARESSRRRRPAP